MRIPTSTTATPSTPPTGPYDAINHELIPKSSGVSAASARMGSLHLWRLHGRLGSPRHAGVYPDMYNGAFAACPDPIDFRAYTLINLYQDANAYTLTGERRRSSAPVFETTWRGVLHPARFELHGAALGDHGRSGGQYDIWQAVFSPAGADGYPKPIFDKLSGAIDPSVQRTGANTSICHTSSRATGDVGAQAQGQDAHLCRQRRQLLSDRLVYFAQESSKR